jgi:hypothetical protein
MISHEVLVHVLLFAYEEQEMAYDEKEKYKEGKYVFER